MATDEMDKLAIRGLIDAYANAATRRDWDLLGSVFADDAVWGTRGIGNDVNIEGREKIVAAITGGLGKMSAFVQMSSAPWIEVNGDTATASVVTLERAVISAEQGGKLQLGVYHDELRRTSAGWKFQKRIFKASNIDPMPGVSN